MRFDRSVLSFDGKVVAVTGAGRGIGAAVAMAFAEFGAAVAVCDKETATADDTAAAIDQMGGAALASTFDVRDDAGVAAFIASAVSEFGDLDVVVNNAAGTFRAPFLDASVNAVDALVAENFTSAANVVRHAVPRMKDGGALLNITSVEAHRAGPGFAVYSAMKAALANFTKTLALELGDRGIRVNAIAPDLIETPGTGPFSADPPLRRLGRPEDVAGVALFLASPLASYVTGSTVHVDGGTWAAGGWHRDTDGAWQP